MSQTKKKIGPRSAPARYEVTPDQQVLVALLNTASDLALLREQHWYRIPVKTAPARAIEARYIAFYQTKVFKSEGWAVNYWAEVTRRSVVTRLELFPDQPHHARAQERYYKFEIGELRRLEKPILSRRGRRSVFVPTTLEKFRKANEINDLFHDSPLEDDLWLAFQRERIEAERQFYVKANQKNYCLDFALFYQAGQIDVECDGDSWHAQTERIPADNERNNELERKGWSILRFNGEQIRNDLEGCLRVVRETANQYGGVITPEGELRYFALGGEGTGRDKQLNLFQETVAEYDARKTETDEG